MIGKKFSFFNRLLLILFAFFSQNLLAADKYPAAPNPFHYITDYTQTLSAQEWRTLEDALIANRSKTSSQIIVVIIPSTEGEAIAGYATNLFNKWGIGRSKHNENNGVLLLIAKNDKKLFIATGRGIEGVLPDAIAASIIRNNITPYFKQDRYAEGIASGLSAIMAAINDEYAPYEHYGENSQETAPFDDFDGLFFFLIMGIVIFLIFRPRGSDRYISPNTLEQVLRSRRNHNMGGFSGGFGGGIGGGQRGSGDSFGGGSSGGGGAGGSW